MGTPRNGSGLLSEPLLTAREVSALLNGVPTSTVYVMAREGRLPCVKVGKHVRFVRVEIERWLEQQTGPTPLRPEGAGAWRPSRFELPPSPWAHRRRRSPARP